MQGFKKSFTMVFKMLLCDECYENLILNGVHVIHRSRCIISRFFFRRVQFVIVFQAKFTLKPVIFQRFVE
jgi:hypothetical protein